MKRLNGNETSTVNKPQTEPESPKCFILLTFNRRKREDKNGCWIRKMSPLPTRCSPLTPTCITLFCLCSATDAVAGRLQAALSMVSPTMKAVVDAIWAVWSIGASIYDYINTSAMEERIHALENVITIHQCVIGLLSAGVLALFTYILFKKLWRRVKRWARGWCWGIGATRITEVQSGEAKTDKEGFYMRGSL